MNEMDDFACVVPVLHACAGWPFHSVTLCVYTALYSTGEEISREKNKESRIGSMLLVPPCHHPLL